MTRWLQFWASLIAATLVSVSAIAGGAVPTQFTLYKNGSNPLPSNPQATWTYESEVYTAITIPARFDQWRGWGAQILHAEFLAAWEAVSCCADTGVGLMLCPPQTQGAQNGLQGCQMLAFFAANDQVGPASYTPGCVDNPGGPFPCVTDITSILQNLLSQGLSNQYFVLVTYGNGENGPDVWDAEIGIVWSTP